MSLKAVHMAFILSAALLAFGFGAWSLTAGQTLLPAARAWAGGSLASGAALIAYFFWFLNKARSLQR